jgi:hypothetical protein
MSKLELSPRQKKNLDILIQRAKDMALTPAQTELVARLSMVESALNTQTGHSNTFNGEFQIRGARWTDLLGKLNPYIIAHKETFAMLAITPFSNEDRLDQNSQRDAVLLYVKQYCASDIDLTPVKDIGPGPFKQPEKYLTWNRFYAWWNTDPKQINRVNEIIMGKDPQRPLSNIYEDIHNQVNLKSISWFDGTVNYAQNDLVGTDAVYTSGTDETMKDIKPDIYLRDYSIPWEAVP